MYLSNILIDAQLERAERQASILTLRTIMLDLGRVVEDINDCMTAHVIKAERLPLMRPRRVETLAA